MLVLSPKQKNSEFDLHIDYKLTNCNENTFTLLTVLILINFGRKRSTTYIDRTEDKATCLKATEYFYKCIKMKDCEKAS